MTTKTEGGAQGSTETPTTTTTTTGTDQGKGGQQTGAETQTQQTGTETGKGKEGASTTTTTTTQEGKGAEGGKGKEGAAAAPDFTKLQVPDNGKEFIDQLTIDTVVDFAKRSGWSVEDAQNAINEQALMLARADHEMLTQLKADADYGGDKLVETQKLAKQAIDLIRPEGHPRREAFLRTLSRAAAGNNIEVVSFFADLGKRIGEDSVGSQTSATRGAERAPEQVLYGGTKTT